MGDIQAGFDLEGFCKKLTSGQDLEKIYYFDARLNHTFKGSAIQGQRAFFNSLRKQKLVEVQLGKIEGPKGAWYQKGVDVKMATFMIRGAHRKEYNLAYMLSNDKDFCPAIDYIQGSYKDRVVNYIFFKKRLTGMLFDLCRRSRSLRDAEVYEFCNLALLKKLKHFTILTAQPWFKKKYPGMVTTKKGEQPFAGSKLVVGNIKVRKKKKAKKRR